MTHQVERWYKVFFMVDSSSNNPKVIISEGCVKFYPVAFFLNPRWPPKPHEISIITITSDVLVVELQFFILFCGYDHAE